MPQQESGTQDQEKHAAGRVLHMHTAHPRVPIPYVTPGDMFTGARSATSMLPSKLPSLRKMAFYGALGGMAALEVLEWPVALAVGAATEVITREQRQQRGTQERGEQRERPATEPGRMESPKPAQGAMT
ncbi:hypothetical protein [Streptomyces sp. NPDC096132]|uniref:hypothetical protein n=1 Tax=Streptomyces sp. NPDC096132 TaxID=3366075 RepID=UPI0037F9984F